MRKIAILVIGRVPDILETVVRLINNNPEWSAIGAETDEAATRLFDTGSFHLVLFGGGVEPESEVFLRTYFSARKPGIPMIQHYGGGSGLLSNEILEVLSGMPE